MKKTFAAIALSLSQAFAPPVFAEDNAPARPATPEEMTQCKGVFDHIVTPINDASGNLRFNLQNCFLARVSVASCQDLFKLAHVSDNVRRIQGGTLNEAQSAIEDRRYNQVGKVYETHCNLIS